MFLYSSHSVANFASPLQLRIYNNKRKLLRKSMLAEHVHTLATRNRDFGRNSIPEHSRGIKSMRVFNPDSILVVILKFETLSIYNPVSLELVGKMSFSNPVLQFEIVGDLIYVIDSESKFYIFRLNSVENGIISNIIRFDLP